MEDSVDKQAAGILEQRQLEEAQKDLMVFLKELKLVFPGVAIGPGPFLMRGLTNFVVYVGRGDFSIRIGYRNNHWIATLYSRVADGGLPSGTRFVDPDAENPIRHFDDMYALEGWVKRVLCL